MKYSIEGETLPVVKIYLEAGESLISESGGRAWFKGPIHTEITSKGGVGKVLGRMFSGESMFFSKYTAEDSAEIVFASGLPGQIRAIDLGAGESIIAQKGSFLCATEGVDLSIYFQKKLGTGVFGGEGFIMQKISGPGLVFIEIDGYCAEYDLGPGEKMVLDTGVLVMMEETVSMDIQMVEGVKNIFFGGEGLFDTIVTGPGKVYLQSMTIDQLARSISTAD